MHHAMVVADCVVVVPLGLRNGEAEEGADGEHGNTQDAHADVRAYQHKDVVLPRGEAHKRLARLDFAKAYLVAHTEATGVGEIVSFDRSIDRVGTVTRREP